MPLLFRTRAPQLHEHSRIRWDDWSVKRGRRHEIPNRDLGGCGCARCGFMEPLHFRNVPNFTWAFVDSGLSDLSHCPGSSLCAQFLFCSSCKCCYVCVGRYARGNHTAARQTNPISFKLIHYPSFAPAHTKQPGPPCTSLRIRRKAGMSSGSSPASARIIRGRAWRQRAAPRVCHPERSES